MPKPPPPPPFYRFANVLVGFVLRRFFGLRVHGLEHVPASGAFVLGANHISSWDPPVVGVALPREVHFMAKKELFESWLIGRISRGLRAFPVDRDANDIGAIKEALRRIQQGHAVGVFFEGTRNRGLDEGVHQGAAFLAQRAGVPLLPTALWREGRAFHVAFGKPLVPEGKGRDEMTDLTHRLTAQVRELLP
jgi:1-acyl-sn-glycerol-3-phosphate acyltransferase